MSLSLHHITNTINNVANRTQKLTILLKWAQEKLICYSSNIIKSPKLNNQRTSQLDTLKRMLINTWSDCKAQESFLTNE